jgi:hypothetical protein
VRGASERDALFNTHAHTHHTSTLHNSSTNHSFIVQFNAMQCNVAFHPDSCVVPASVTRSSTPPAARPALCKGELVEFLVITDANGKPKADSVTGVDGSDVTRTVCEDYYCVRSANVTVVFIRRSHSCKCLLFIYVGVIRANACLLVSRMMSCFALNICLCIYMHLTLYHHTTSNAFLHSPSVRRARASPNHPCSSCISNTCLYTSVYALTFHYFTIAFLYSPSVRRGCASPHLPCPSLHPYASICISLCIMKMHFY